jgi:hypothetical protein
VSALFFGFPFLYICAENAHKYASSTSTGIAWLEGMGDILILLAPMKGETFGPNIVLSFCPPFQLVGILGIGVL